MKFAAVLILGLLFPAAAFAADADMQKAADAAQAWVALVDANNYAQSWDAASPLLKSKVAEWETSGKQVRDPMGAVVTRKLSSVSFAASLPGVPDGQYAIVKFGTQFANKASATETVTLAMDGGSWKTAGYFVK